jgi:hypothetical protein
MDDLPAIAKDIMDSGAYVANALDSSKQLKSQLYMVSSNDVSMIVTVTMDTNRYFASNMEIVPTITIGSDTDRVTFNATEISYGKTTVMTFNVPWIFLEAASILGYEAIINIDANNYIFSKVTVKMLQSIEHGDQTVVVLGNVDSIKDCWFMRSNLSGIIGGWCHYNSDENGTRISVDQVFGTVSNYFLHLEDISIHGSDGSSVDITEKQAHWLGRAFEKIEGSA